MFLVHPNAKYQSCAITGLMAKDTSEEGGERNFSTNPDPERKLVPPEQDPAAELSPAAVPGGTGILCNLHASVSHQDGRIRSLQKPQCQDSPT